MNHQSNIRECR